MDHLYVALPLEEHSKLLDLVELTSRECLDVKVVPDLLQFIALRARLEDLDGLPIINVNDVPLQGLNSFVKRIIDVSISGVALAVLAIPLGIISLIVKLSSHGPVFYRQERMGLDGRSFMILKFRSMRVDAEATSGPVWAIKDDPRRTRIGRLLRQWSLDELPQIWNVLRGEMSVVGPRPERPELTTRYEELIPGYARRHEIPPGITGLAQIHGRYHTDPEYKLGHDLQYLVNWSPVLDLQILGRTVWVLARRRV